MTITSLTPVATTTSTPSPCAAQRVSAPGIWVAAAAATQEKGRSTVSVHSSADDAWRALWAQEFDDLNGEEIAETLTGHDITVPCSLDPLELDAYDIATVLEALPDFRSSVSLLPATNFFTSAVRRSAAA